MDEAQRGRARLVITSTAAGILFTQWALPAPMHGALRSWWQ
jgi:hypothetical protein